MDPHSASQRDRHQPVDDKPLKGERRGHVRRRLIQAAIAVTLAAISAACGGSSRTATSPAPTSTFGLHATPTTLDTILSGDEGFPVSGCHANRVGERLALGAGDPTAKVYQCTRNLGVMLERDGAVSDFDAAVSSSQGLTAGKISVEIIARMARNGDAPSRIDCGRSQGVQIGDRLRCTVTFPDGLVKTLVAMVKGGERNSEVTVSVPRRAT